MARKAIEAGAPADHNPTVRYAKLELNGEIYYLAFSFNALAMGEEMSGLNLMQAIRSLGDLSVGQTRALLFAALRKRHPKLTLSQVGDLIEFENLPAVTRAIGQALENSMPEHPPQPAPADEPGAETAN